MAQRMEKSRTKTEPKRGWRMTGSADQLGEPAKGVASENKYLTLGGCQGDGANIGEIFVRNEAGGWREARIDSTSLAMDVACSTKKKHLIHRQKKIYVERGGSEGKTCRIAPRSPPGGFLFDVFLPCCSLFCCYCLCVCVCVCFVVLMFVYCFSVMSAAACGCARVKLKNSN